MLRSLWLLFVYASFLGLSVNAPFVATLGYVWVDTFQPQLVAYIILNQIPVAMIMGMVAVGSYLLVDRRDPPPLSLQTVLHVSMAIWVTCSMIWAEVPDAAWVKWDWAFKTLVFTAFVPFVIRSRVQIEAFVQTYVFSLAANFLPFGVKVLISGGGYGRDLGLQGGNSGFGEGGLLSTACLMSVPLSMYLASNSRLIPKVKVLPLAYYGMAALAIATAIGTYERSALIGLVVLGIYMWIRTQKKFLFGIVLAICACVIVYTSSSSWKSRISTTETYQTDDSALVRLLVWKWTIGYVATHPLGGGFVSYLVDHVEVPQTGGTPGHTEFGRAFHSSYFEVLGEQGIPGITIFLTIVGSIFFKLRRIAKRARKFPELQWVASLSDAVQSSMAVFLSSGAFVGLAFQPMLWYTIAMGASLSAYMWRVESQDQPVAGGLRAAVPTRASAIPAAPQTDGWRNRVPSRSVSKSA